MKKVLITGVTGFLGRYLESLLMQDFEVVGLDKAPGQSHHREANMTDRQRLSELMMETQPDFVVPLAAAMKDSFRVMFRSNVLGFENLLESVSLYQNKTGKRPLIIFPSSSAIYDPHNPTPITEESGICPTSFYGLTKYVDMMRAQEYGKANGLRTIGLRIFNLCGPGQNERFVISGFCKQLVELEKLAPSDRVMRTGGLDFVRDFVDVRDVIRAFQMLIKNGPPDAVSSFYNVCSGRPTHLTRVIEILKEIVPFEFEVRENPLTENSDIVESCGSYEKLRNAYGWEPAISLRQSVQDTYLFWKEKLQNPEVSR